MNVISERERRSSEISYVRKKDHVRMFIVDVRCSILIVSVRSKSRRGYTSTNGRFCSLLMYRFCKSIADFEIPIRLRR